MPRLISVNVGLPREVPWQGKTVRTAIWKAPVTDRRMARKFNIDGDAQADLAGHGGEIRAVMVYQLASYDFWEAQLGRSDFTYGQFGENFTVEGLSDEEVFIGDRYRIGEALFEVTQPRVTCYRVGIRMNEPKMPALLVSHHRPGFYFRVLEEGLVGAGDEITKMTEGPERITVAAIDALLYLPGHARELLERAVRIPALSPGWRESLKALLQENTNGNPGLTGSSAALPAWAGFRSLQISRVDRETEGVVSVCLESPDHTPLPAALPGQFLVIKLGVIPDKPPVLRNYSLSGAPDRGWYRISVKREQEGVGSSFVHTHLKAGDTVEVSAPRGSFTLAPGEGPVVLLSAGIGITPVLAMLYSLAAQKSARQVWWLYGARNGSAHPFAAEASQLISALINCRSYIAYSNPAPDDRCDVYGRLDISTLDKLQIPREADFYLCGPVGFLKTFAQGLREWGAAAQRIHQEIFGPGTSSAPGAAAPLPQNGSGPLVAFTRSRVTVSWNPQYQNILELAEAANVTVKWSCRTGVCHACECSVIGGEVQYSPEPLEPPAQGNVLICCSTPAGDLQLDL
jgi:ferredoxin-NADP reductase/MOSC domain-containing protein YiiM